MEINVGFPGKLHRCSGLMTSFSMLYLRYCAYLMYVDDSCGYITLLKCMRLYHPVLLDGHSCYIFTLLQYYVNCPNNHQTALLYWLSLVLSLVMGVNQLWV